MKYYNITSLFEKISPNAYFSLKGMSLGGISYDVPYGPGSLRYLRLDPCWKIYCFAGD